uniref:SsgA family sporulation/cell division regulator n=1 Tax=Streptosporangium sp. CA-256172 TaxID=3240076 RepID=UPI003F496F29
MSATQVRTALMVCFADRPNQAFKARALYELADPYAMQLQFPSPSGMSATSWTFARSLLAQALGPLSAGPTGEGDVAISPAEAENYLSIVLHPHGPAPCRLYARREELAAFLAETYRRVPAGREDAWLDLDWDRALTALTRKMRRDAS